MYRLILKKSIEERCEGVFEETEFPLSVYENTQLKSTNTPPIEYKGKPCTH